MAYARYSCLPIPFYRQMLGERTMTVFDWLEIAADLPITGTELPRQILPGYEAKDLERLRAGVESKRLQVSQLTTTPDLTHQDAAYRHEQVEQTLRDIDAAATLGATCVRVTAGQDYPGLSRQDGIRYAVDGFQRLLERAARRGVSLAYENHYKGFFWQYPDFSHRAEIFLEIVGRLRESGLRVNFDTSNQVIMSEDPLAVLREVKELVVHTHCSDRLRMGEYPQAVAGEGVVDFPAIFETLRRAGFAGWLSVEYTGPEGLAGMKRALDFVRRGWEATLASSSPAL